MKYCCSFFSVLLFLIIGYSTAAQTFTVTEAFDYDDGSAPYCLREAIRLVNESPSNTQKIINFALTDDGLPTDNMIFQYDLPHILNNNVTINGYNSTTDSKIRLLGNKEISDKCISFGPDNSMPNSNLNNSINNVIFDKFLIPLRFQGSTNFLATECEFYCTSMFLSGGNTMIECRQSNTGQLDNNLILPQYFGSKPDNVTNTKGIALYNDCSLIQINNNQIHQCDQGIELFSASSINITSNITRFINGQISRFGNLYFCIVGNSMNISFGGAGNENLIYGLSETQYYDVGISCDNVSNILVYENSFDCLTVPIQNSDASMTIDYVYSNAAGGSGVPGEVVYIYQSGTFSSDFNNPRCNICTNGYLFIGTAEVNDKGYWCLNYPTSLTLIPDDYITGYSIMPPIGNNQGNTSDFVTGCHNANDQCPTLDISINNTLESCIQMCYDATVLQNGVPVSNSENISYQWFLPGSGEEYTPEVCVLNEGTLTLRVTYKCCSYQLDEIVEFPNINLTVTPVNADCNNNFGSASVSVSSGQSPFVFTINTIPPQTSGSIFQNNYNFTNIPVGDYIATVQDANNCSTTMSFTIEGSSSLMLALFKTDATCNQNNGSASAVVTGGAPPITFLWETGASTETITNLQPGTYSITVTDINQCIAIDSITINASDGPAIIITKMDATCGNSDGSASVQITGGMSPYDILWSNGEITSTINGLAQGIYSVTVTDNNNCVVTGDVTINSENGPTLNITKTDASCDLTNGTATITIDGGATPYIIDWSNGENTLSIQGLIPGLYSVTVTDAAGCQASEMITINSVPGPNVTIDVTDANCGQNDGSATAVVSSGLPPFTYLWSNGSLDSSITGVIAGQYTVTVTDANDCIDIETATINSAGGPLVEITKTDANCGQSNGSAISNVTLGAIPYKYLWSNGSMDSSISSVIAGEYTVTVTDANGCVVIATTTINSTGGPSVEITIINAICGQSNGSAAAIVTLGAEPYKFIWSNGSIDSAISGLMAGQYTLTVTDANNCIEIATATINSIGGPSVEITKNDAICGSASGTASASISGGLDPYVILWSNGATTAEISNLLPGNYQITVTDFQGCITIKSVEIISIGNTLTAQSIVTSTSCGIDNGTVLLTISGGVSPFQFTINGPSGPLQNNEVTSSSLFETLTAGSYSYLILDGNGCSTSGTFILGNSQSVDFVISQQGFQCAQKSGTLTISAQSGTAPFSFTINNIGQNNTGIFTGLIPGQYNIRMTDAQGCSKDSAFTTNAASNIVAVDDTIKFDFYSNPVIIDVVSNDQLNGETSVILNSVSQDVFNGAGLFIGTLLKSNNENSMEFYFHGDYDPITKKYTLNYPLESERMDYVICLASCPEACDTGTILMINDATCIDNNGDYVNTFTPNGDGQNDVLILPQFPKCKIGHSDFKVFNRWGAPVLSKANYDNNWDGKNDNGEELPGGTYYYVLNLKTTDGKSFVIKNFVELIR